jgi:hypothetical protein
LGSLEPFSNANNAAPQGWMVFFSIALQVFMAETHQTGMRRKGEGFSVRFGPSAAIGEVRNCDFGSLG